MHALTSRVLPHPLLDTIENERFIKNDAHLARDLNLAPPVISKIRNGKLGVSGEVMIRIHEAYDMPIARIKELLGMPVFVREEMQAA